MKRRKFLVGGLAGAAVLAASCSKPEEEKKQSAPAVQTKIKWRMATTWPKNFPGLGTGANNLAKHIGEMSEGRLQVEVFGGV